MAILVNQNTRVLIQGITGTVGRDFAERMLKHGTPLVAGVTPGKGGQNIFGVPVYNSVEDAVLEKNVNCSLVVVPAPFVKDAVLEAIDVGIKTVMIYAEGVPVHDAAYIVQYSKLKGTRIIGPNSAGVISPGKCNVSDINDEFVKAGNIGIVSKSGTMTYEVMNGIFQYGLGVSTVACLGGDPIIGMRHADVLKLFEKDDETKAVILLGEIGGTDELEAAKYIKSMSKPVFAYIAGWAAPPGKRMGHAGAIIAGEKDTALYKLNALREAGAFTSKTIKKLVKTISDNL
jgi:succinyl-CoA synthetase alpha subunit